MPKIRFEWDSIVPNTILISYPLAYTWDDYHHAISDLVEMVGEGNLIHFINVHEKGAQFPKGSPTANQRMALEKLKLGIIVYVTVDKQLMSSIGIFSDILKRREGHDYAVVSTLDEARPKLRELIQKHRSSNP